MRPPRPQAALALALAVLGGVVIGLGLFSLRTDPSYRRPAGREFMALFDPGVPLLVPGEQTSLAEADGLVEGGLYRPVGEPPTQVWYSRETGESGIRFGADLVLLQSAWPAGTDVAARYQEMAKGWDAGYVIKIGGQPAWVVPKGSAGEGSPPVNEVYVSIGLTEVALYGTASVDTLIEKAESLTTTAAE